MQLLPAFAGMPDLNKVYNCDALTILKSLPDNSIDMVLTSPPYDNLRTYNGYTFDFQPIARETFRVLKTGGVCVWVVGDATINGSETLTSMRQALYFVDVCGFRMHQTIVYEKDAMPFPPQKRYYSMFEYCFTLSKGEPHTFNGLLEKNLNAGRKLKATHRQTNGTTKQSEEILIPSNRLLTNVWRISAGYMRTTKDVEAYQHPAMFPEELARRHIETWTNAGDTVLDYFGGSGTTAKMARQFGRNYITCDISAEYCDLMRRRLSQAYTPLMPIFLEQESA